jgi:hypothetical protein
MYFDPSPQNMTTLLVIALAVVTLVFLLKGRYDSNLPLLYFSATVMIATVADRPVNPFLVMAGAACALVLRFEFMGKGFTRFFSLLTILSISATVVVLLDMCFGGDGRFF